MDSVTPLIGRPSGTPLDDPDAEAYAQELAASAPPFTDAQAERLRALLLPVVEAAAYKGKRTAEAA